MGKIGDYEYPEFTFTECRKIVESIYKKGITRGDVLAPELGHKSPESGTFRNKITSLQRFGLIEGDWKEFKLTELGEKIAKPLNVQEFKEAAIESIKKVSLLKELWSRVGSNIPETGLWADLVQITGVSRSVAEKQEAKIRKLYMDAVQYLKEEKKPVKEESKMEKDKRQDEGTKPEISGDAIGRVTVKGVGYIDVIDEISYNIAKEYLKLIAKKLGIKESEKKEA